RQEVNEQKQQREEKPDRADEHSPVPLRWLINAPRRRQIIPMQTGNDDHETLEPHADADDHRDQPQQQKIRANFLEPEKLRRQSITKNERPVIHGVWTMHAVPNRVALILIAAVPAERRFDHISENND